MSTIFQCFVKTERALINFCGDTEDSVLFITSNQSNYPLFRSWTVTFLAPLVQANLCAAVNLIWWTTLRTQPHVSRRQSSHSNLPEILELLGKVTLYPILFIRTRAVPFPLNHVLVFNIDTTKQRESSVWLLCSTVSSVTGIQAAIYSMFDVVGLQMNNSSLLSMSVKGLRWCCHIGVQTLVTSS